MNAVAPLIPDDTETLSWEEICARYPDQYVCLVDVVHPRRGDPDIVTARVVGRGTTHDAAFEPIRDLDAKYPRFSIRFTSESTTPLIRPSFVLDDDDLQLLQP
jgi:hypothetical protein